MGQKNLDLRFYTLWVEGDVWDDTAMMMRTERLTAAQAMEKLDPKIVERRERKKKQSKRQRVIEDQ